MTTSRKPEPPLGEPSDLTGQWTDWQQVRFWHREGPFDVKYFIETISGVLLHRDADQSPLTYYGSTPSAGDSRAIWLRHEAVVDARNLYSLGVERKAPRKWVSELRFQTESDRKFAFMCSKLNVAEEIAWSDASPTLLEQRLKESIIREVQEASFVEDPAPVAAMQRAVLNALRSGMGVFTAHKEGGTHIFFDGSVFRRMEYGEEPNLDEVYSTDAAILTCLRQFFDWETRRPVSPHRPTELAAWTCILNQLKKRT